MSSTTKAEIGAAYINIQEVINEQNILHELGHPQQCTLIVADDTVTNVSSTAQFNQNEQK